MGTEAETDQVTEPCYTNHPIERAKERYDVDLTVSDLDAIAETIQKGNSIVAKRDCGDREGEHHILRYAGVHMRVVYKPSVAKVMTFLPLTQQQKTNQLRRQRFKQSSRQKSTKYNRAEGRNKSRGHPKRDLQDRDFDHDD